MSELTKELMELVWGTKSSPGLSDTIFCRWTQGFVFSESEGSALEQFEGGPCAVIAPVQAFLLKKLLFSSEKSSWRDCPEEERKELLCHTLCDILESACCDNSGSYCLVSWLRGKTTEETAGISGSLAESSCQVEHSSALAVEELGFERFHALIQKRSFRSLSELKDAVLDQYSMWGNKFGVLLFLYSVLLTKGIENIKNEIEDASEPLIDPVYGHGSQSLINLLLTGHAVSNVWDGDRECSGMKLLGIHEQAAVGFLTLMEALRYCKVGSYLKSPKFPIWIVGSETHLTVFFAKAQLGERSSFHWFTPQMAAMASVLHLSEARSQYSKSALILSPQEVSTFVTEHPSLHNHELNKPLFPVKYPVVSGIATENRCLEMSKSFTHYLENNGKVK
ncbi:ubiquitin carboxyl-terminal hydrolase MINDY-3 isoform X3 [Lepus europaeus]|uniref:ubiquitin carboxyl-terminal hydrolase MINDY-3 isoform X3 n=1 Tax=Lepus europaeus TaxID=9983 RepID=UPI002B4699F9|nr:ubiquitin carboxyl-terminal hydrolase MINDY-3 isoform X3 [Lepus europaeus]